MVGFGSSLRMSRRPGWEAAYLDYETLKLLLSQIEAVYEEEGHKQRRAAAGFGQHDEEDDNGQAVAVRDYRYELFLEWDSDIAYASVIDDDDDEDDDNDDVFSQQQQHYQHPVGFVGGGGSTTEGIHPGQQSGKKPFLLSYSKETSSSEDEDEENRTGCGAGVSFSSWASWDHNEANTRDRRKPRKRRSAKSDISALEEEDAFYITGAANNNNNNTFYVSGGEDSSLYFQPNSSLRQPSSILSAPVQAAGEKSSLLPHHHHQHNAPSMYSFSSVDPVTMTPPRSMQYQSVNAEGLGSTLATPNLLATMTPNIPMTGSKSNTGATPFTTGNKRQTDQKARRAAEEVRKQQRRERRKMRMEKKKRQARERKVPRHLRLAHAKARAITERFLGLLRAETEKILLFAQSRLGELADTAGSLRFPALEDNDYVPSMNKAHHHQHHHHHQTRVAGSSFDYPFSDGGLHPSASSSEDEGATPNGSMPWSDDEDESHASQQRINSSADETLNRSNRSKITPPQGHAVKKGRMNMEKTKTAVRRQIDHFTELRQRRPVFLRNEQVLGEDMLLISAVEEADGYTAVGVELMHVLRYICVNLVAVRKICRKHDRLLMNRMLGGYYKRAKNHRGTDDRYSHFEDVNTLGGQIAKVSGDIYDAHPALIGNLSHYKLVGIYDTKIQRLANSRTVQVISSCLALALSEHEVTRSRADALTKLNSIPSPSLNIRTRKRQEGGRPPLAAGGGQRSVQRADSDDGLSTASCISLTRLQFTVTSIFALREAARFKTGHYNSYVSRSMLTFTGRPTMGAGLDGCSRETLDFLVSYNPDSILLHDTAVLFEGLRKGRWMETPTGDLMYSALVVGATPVDIPAEAAPALLKSEELAVVNAVSVEPELRIMLERLLNGQLPGAALERPSLFASPDLSFGALQLNRITLFLFSMNYFVSHATTSIFVDSTGKHPASASLVIGAPNLSAILIAIIHCAVLSQEQLAPVYDVGVLKCHFALSATAAIAGNIVHALGVNNGSVPMAMLGRFIFGFSSVEILHRQLVASCRPSQVVAQATRLVHARVFGIIAGLAFGCLADAVPFTIMPLGIRAMQSTSWIMAFLWLTHLVRILVQLRKPRRVFDDHVKSREDDYDERDTVTPVESEDHGYDSSESEPMSTPKNVLYRSSSPDNTNDPFIKTYGGGSGIGVPLNNEHRKSVYRQLKSFMNRIRMLLGYHVGIPITLFITVYVNYAFEAFFTGTPLMTNRYFQWSGVQAAGFLGLLALAILPIHFVAEFITRRYEERTVLKRALGVVMMGLTLMINYESMFSLVQRAPKLLSKVEAVVESETATLQPYDWKLGVIQYVVGLTITFVGLISMEGAALSLLSKLAPLRLRSIVINVGTISVFLCFTARILGDAQILFVGVSHRLIDTDMVNAVVIPLLLVSFPILFLVRKHFFFLI